MPYQSFYGLSCTKPIYFCSSFLTPCSELGVCSCRAGIEFLCPTVGDRTELLAAWCVRGKVYETVTWNTAPWELTGSFYTQRIISTSLLLGKTLLGRNSGRKALNLYLGWKKKGGKQPPSSLREWSLLEQITRILLWNGSSPLTSGEEVWSVDKIVPHRWHLVISTISNVITH